MKKLFLVVGISLGASACSWLPNHFLDYRKAESIEPMTVPDGMVFIGEQPLYSVPDGQPAPVYEKEKKDTIPKPPRLIVANAIPDEEEPRPENEPDPSSTRVVMARDGNGYPIIMMHTPFNWAWEYVGQAIAATDLKIDDRDRDSGTFYIKTPKKYEVDGREAQVKLSYTANGIQITVLDRKGAALLEKGAGQQIIQRIYDEL
ncbi:MAG: outer membrane protein assembly factor BamC [Alcanivoracaceae bacterium]|nr:outer membrane protein assembly factor BamC [Alcanivoracaceae bacterium]